MGRRKSNLNNIDSIKLNAYFKIKDLANKFNITVHDEFAGNKTYIWHLKNSNTIIMPAKFLNTIERVELILLELQNHNLETVFILPAIREAIKKNEPIRLLNLFLNAINKLNPNNIQDNNNADNYISNNLQTNKEIELLKNHQDLTIVDKKNYCEVCGKEIFDNTRMNMLGICRECIRIQVRYNIDYNNCKQEKTGRFCLDCPINIYKNCLAIKKILNSDLLQLQNKQAELKIFADRTTTKINDNNFNR